MSLTIIRKVAVTGGTVLRAANNLGDVASAATSFTNIKQAATTSATGVSARASSGDAETDDAKHLTIAEFLRRLGPYRNALAPRQAVVFDGTALASISNIPAFGTGDFTVAVWVKCPTLVSGFDQLFIVANTGGFGFGIKFNTLKLSAIVAGTSYLTQANTTLSPGKWMLATYTRTGSTGTYYLNSVADGAIVDSTNYTAGLNSLGSIRYAVETPLVPYVWNRCLSAAEVLALYEQGAPAAADYNSASNTSLLTGNASDFSGATGSWNLDGGAATISGGKLNFTSGATPYTGSCPLVKGRKYRFTLTVDSLTGTLRYYDGTSYVTITTVAGTLTVEFTATATYGVLALNSLSGTAVIDNITFYNLGLLCAPEGNAPGNGLVWNDMSGAPTPAHIILPTTGAAWAVPDNRVNRIRGTTSTNGNQQLLAASTLLPANKLLVLRVRARARSGTPSVTVGNGSGLSNIVASVALTTAWKTLTLAAADIFPTSDSPLWIGSNSTDVVEWDIAVEPLSY